MRNFARLESCLMKRLAIAALCLMLLLTACGASGNDDAQLGQNPGGGYFGANVNVGTINPSKVCDGNPWLGESAADRLPPMAATFPPIQTQRRPQRDGCS